MIKQALLAVLYTFNTKYISNTTRYIDVDDS